MLKPDAAHAIGQGDQQLVVIPVTATIGNHLFLNHGL